MLLYADVAAQYADFAAYARESPCFAHWADQVARDEAVLTRIAALPAIKQQPNLVFAAARWCGVPAPGPYEALRKALLADDPADPDGITATILSRSTQTNEVGRLATLAPALAMIARSSGRPLALVEAGASAGVCLYPDRYRYRYTRRDDGTVTSWDPRPRGSLPDQRVDDALELSCRVGGPASTLAEAVAAETLTIAWRGGLDLSPVPADDPDATQIIRRR